MQIYKRRQLYHVIDEMKNLIAVYILYLNERRFFSSNFVARSDIIKHEKICVCEKMNKIDDMELQNIFTFFMNEILLRALGNLARQYEDRLYIFKAVRSKLQEGGGRRKERFNGLNG